MKLRFFLLTILLSIILLVECTGKISEKAAGVNTGSAEGTGKISGKVTDALTGKPLPGSNVLILGRNMGTATDKNGLYTISNLPTGSYSMQARMMYYKWVTINYVIVAADLETIIDFQLTPAGIKREGVILGPTGKISGKVTDQKTGEALPDVGVFIKGTKLETITDTNGIYIISGVSPNTYPVEAVRMGYRTVTIYDVIVKANSTTIIDFQLSSAVVKDKGVILGPK
jgi:hypothetical protein